MSEETRDSQKKSDDTGLQKPARPAADRESPAPVEESKPVPPKFIFKIVKADPKNSFDFEDVADK